MLISFFIFIANYYHYHYNNIVIENYSHCFGGLFMDYFQHFEQLLAFHSAPTLAGIKTGSLISINKQKLKNFQQIKQKYSKCLKCSNVYMFTVSDSTNYRLLLIYNKDKLRQLLSQKSIQEFLQSYGYKDFTNILACLRYLKIRMLLQKGFPHEIGIFLGYPLADVKGFIKNNGQNFKCCGPWKVYADLAAAEKLFSQYAQCSQRFCKCLANGFSLEDIIGQAV